MRNYALALIIVLSMAFMGCSQGNTDASGEGGGHQPPLAEATAFTPDQVQQWISGVGSRVSVVVVDVRDPREFADGHVPGARNIPMSEVNDHLKEFQGYDHVVFICNQGGRSSRAAVACAGVGVEGAGYLAYAKWKEGYYPVSFGGWK